jgi:hypothetical protein
MWGDRDEGLYVASEFLIMRMNSPLRHQALAYRGFIDHFGQLDGDHNSQIITLLDTTNGDAFLNNFFLLPGAPGHFVGSHEVALDQNDIGGLKFAPGVRMTIGYRFRDGVSVEFVWHQMENIKHSAIAGLTGPTFNGGRQFENSFLTAPFFNIPPDLAGPGADVISNVVPVPVPQGVSVISVPGVDVPPAQAGVFVTADEIALLEQLRGLPLAAYGIFNAAETMYLNFTQSFISMELNFRLPVYQDEHFRTYAILGVRQIHITENFEFRTIDQDIFGLERPEWSATYGNKIDQIMYGLQCGSGNEVYLGGGWALSVEGRVGAFGDTISEHTKIERGDLEYSVSHRRKDTSVVPMFQAGGYLWWYPIEGVQLRAGYEFLGLFNVKRSPHQVDFNVGTLQPEFKDMFLRLDGFTVGASLIF